MSRKVRVQGKVKITNMEFAKEAIRESSIQGIKIENGHFLFNDYDYGDGVGKDREIAKIEKIYTQKIEAEKRRLAEELRRLEELRQLEERKKLKTKVQEMLRKIEEEQALFREEQFQKVIANAKKQGYRIKKEVREDKTIKLVLERRVY